jgi:hypothetical protein
MESSYTYNESVNDKRKSREYLSERLFLNLFVSRTKILSHFDRRQSLASAFALLANWSLKISVTISEIGKSEEISSFSFCSTTPILKIVLEYSFNCEPNKTISYELNPNYTDKTRVSMFCLCF